MEKIMNLEEAVEIGSNTYWVGSSNRELLKRNVYLRVFQGNGVKFNMLIDPGAPADIEPVALKSAPIVGGLANIHTVFANHQDPDVIGNASHLLKLNPSLLFFMTEDTWRLAQYYGIPKTNFKSVEQFSDFTAVFNTGHRLQFIPTPFCHFRGACMLFDPETRILFTGDLFGGIAAAGLSASASNWTGIKAFHELYMPSKQALKLAVKRIRELSPAPVMIAPQHGSLISGNLIDLFLDKMNDLNVGLDIITSLNEKHGLIISAINDMLVAARDILGNDAVDRCMKFFQPDGSYPAIFTITRNATVTDIKAEPLAALSSLAKLLFRECTDQQKRTLQLKILVILVEHNLPPVESAIEWEESVKTEVLAKKSGKEPAS